MYKTIQSSRLYQQIVQQIEDSIVKGDLKPGAQLPAERELALQFGVSRSAVREAVKTLAEKGLVEAYSGRGTFVTNGTSHAIRQSLDLMVKIGQPDGAEHLTVVREMFEPEIAALAATRVEEQHLALMREAIAVMDRCADECGRLHRGGPRFSSGARGSGGESDYPVAGGFDCRPVTRTAHAKSSAAVAARSADNFITGAFFRLLNSVTRKRRVRPCGIICVRCATT